MTPKLLLQIFNWTWLIAHYLDIAANEFDSLRDYQKLIGQIKWMALGGAFFYCTLFFTQSW